jgi:hypothetical protein
MGVVIPQVITEDRASGAQVIGGSLKFVSGSSHYLNRTPGSAGNRKTWTWSAWVKRSGLTAFNTLFQANHSSSPWFVLGFANNDKLEVTQTAGVSPSWETAALFRNVSAWYHVVFAVDTTSATSTMAGSATDRFRLYVNGVQYVISGGSVPSQNADLQVNNTVAHTIGGYGSSYSNQYITDINFIDGQALTPSYFGFTDPLTNTWRPKKYTGTYGTNGFYLPMDNQNDFEIDKSGNGNDWTKGNFSGTSNNPDVLPDSPSGISYSTVSSAGITTVSQRKPTNWCTLNPAFRSSNSGNTYTDGNLVAINGTGGYSFIYNSTIPVSSGKWYAECTMSDYTGSPSPTIGIQDAGNKTDVGNELVGAATGDVGYDLKAGKIYKDANYNFATGYATATSGDTIGIKLDLDNNTIEFFKNGVSVGAAVAVTTGTGLKVFAGGQGDGSASIGCSFNWNFGQKPFKYNPPEGFKTLCLANLPRPTKAAVRPDKYFNTVLYTGDGNDGRTVTGVGFQPDFVWIKSRNNALSHSLYDSVRGVQKRLLTNLTNAESDRVSTGDGVVSFDADGFSLGADGNENRDTYTHVAWCWKTGDVPNKTYTVKVVSDSGNKYRFNDYGTSAFTIELQEGGTFTFDQSDSSNSGHPLRFSTTSDGTHGAGTEYTTGVVTNGTPGSAGAYTRITVPLGAPTLYYYCTVHSGMGGQANTPEEGYTDFGGTIPAKISTNVDAGFSIGTYTADGSNANRTVGHGLGVAPEFIIVKNRDTTGRHWLIWHKDFNDNDKALLFTDAAVADNRFGPSAPTSTVFGLYGGQGNYNSDDHVFYAFAGVEGYSKFGSYTGNGNADGTFVYLGFKPAWIMIRSTSNLRNWAFVDSTRSYANVANHTLAANRADGEAYYGNGESVFGAINKIDLLSNGFKPRENATWANGSGETYIYAAFAEAPTNNLFGGQANAR